MIESYKWVPENVGDVEDYSVRQLLKVNKRLRQELDYYKGVGCYPYPPNNLPPISMKEIKEKERNQQENKKWDEMFTL